MCRMALLRDNPQCEADAYMRGQVMCQENVQAGRVEGRQLQAPCGLDVCVDMHEGQQQEDAPNQNVMSCTISHALIVPTSVISLHILDVTDPGSSVRRPGNREKMAAFPLSFSIMRECQTGFVSAHLLQL